MEKSIPRIGMFICDQGGRLARALDLAALTAKISKLKNVARCEIVPDPEADAFLDSVIKDLESGRVDRLLWVGRLAPPQIARIQARLAAAINPYLLDGCSLEDQGVLTDGLQPTARQRKALTLLQMAAARTRLLEPLEPLEAPASDAALVIGAGIAGLHAAAALAERGKRVFVIEKESGVGGKVALLSRFYPLLCDPRCGLEFVLRSLRQSERVEFHTLTRLKKISGSPGNFEAVLEKAPRYVRADACNSCGLCTSVCPVDLPTSADAVQDLPPLQPAKGISSLVRTTRKAIHPATPMAFPAAFVVERQRCPSDCRRCEAVCPTQAVALDQQPAEETIRFGAALVTTGWDPYPLSKVAEYGYGKHDRIIGNLEFEQVLGLCEENRNFLTHLPVEGLQEVGFIQCAGSRDDRHLPYCSSVCCSATLKQINHLKKIRPDIRCYVFYQDIRSPGFEEELYVRTKSLDHVIFVRGLPVVKHVPENSKKVALVVEDTLSGKELNLNLDLLVLAGGMRPAEVSQEVAELFGLPRNEHGFFSSHLQCYPDESRRTGVYIGGCAREPMNVSNAIESGQHAAMKALAFMEGTVVITPTYPVVEKNKCDQCKRCVEECPFGTFIFDEKGFPSPELTRCRQCGNCMGVCPVSAISLRNNTIKQTAAQIEALNTAFAGEGEPVILAFLCENDAYPAAVSAVDQGLPLPVNVIHVKVRCAGAVNNALVADALSLGIDGVLIAGCADGQCHYINGNELVRKRSGDLRDKLKEMMIEPERVRFESLEIRQAQKYADIVRSYVQELKALGPNPFKI